MPIFGSPFCRKHHSNAARTLLRAAKYGARSAPVGKTGQSSGRARGRVPGGKDTGSHPIYVWNPGAATENLPAIKPGENNRQ